MYDTGGDQALHEISRSKPILKNRVDPEVEEAVVKWLLIIRLMANKGSAMNSENMAYLFLPGGVRSVWQRHDLEIFDKRLKALEARMAQDGIILTEAQMIALERKQENGKPWVRLKPSIQAIWALRIPTMLAISKELEGYTRQTFIDTYSRGCFCQSV